MGRSVVGKWFVSALDKIAKQVDEEGGKTVVSKVEHALGKYQEEGHINEEEKDALRHYYGMRALGNEYGGTIAWTVGYLNEGFDLLPTIFSSEKSDYKIQADVDIYNNDIALKHIEEGIGYDLKEGMSVEEVRGPLEYLKIPPAPEEYGSSK